MIAGNEKDGRVSELAATVSADDSGAIRATDDRNLVDAVMDAVAPDTLANRIIASWHAWRARNEKTGELLPANAVDLLAAESMETLREADGLDIESDPIDPEAQLCIDCLQYPATYRARCFGCGARLYIAIRRTPA